MDYLHEWRQLLGVDLVLLVRLFCWFSIAIVTAARLVPASRTRFLTYGARVQQVPPSNKRNQLDKQRNHPRWLDELASVDVPHSWFTHFYVLSLILSLFWLTTIGFQSTILQVVSAAVPMQKSTTSARASWLCVLLMVLQSARRLSESIKFASGSTSRMWIGHYVFGLAFYFFTNLAVWVEGVHDILASVSERAARQQHWLNGHFCFGIMVFILSSYLQYLAHAHLASLPKYSIPRHWLFRTVVAPHYTAECLIYLALAIIAAPDQQLFNGSLLCIVLLTALNLGITAQGTKTWMLSKFRESEIELQKKYCMVPGLW